MIICTFVFSIAAWNVWLFVTLQLFTFILFFSIINEMVYYCKWRNRSSWITTQEDHFFFFT